MTPDLDVDDDTSSLNLDWGVEIDDVPTLARVAASEVDAVVQATMDWATNTDLLKDAGGTSSWLNVNDAADGGYASAGASSGVALGSDIMPISEKPPVSTPNPEREVKPRKRTSVDSVAPSAPTSRRKKKPKGMPKRPLSAYNIFFQKERPRVLELGDENAPKIGFQELAKTIGKRWGVVPKDQRKEYEELADQDSLRYRREMEAFNHARDKKPEPDKTAGLGDIRKFDLAAESNLKPAPSFGNLSVSKLEPPAPSTFWNMNAPLQARLPWVQPAPAAAPSPSYPTAIAEAKTQQQQHEQLHQQQQQIQQLIQQNMQQQQQMYRQAKGNNPFPQAAAPPQAVPPVPQYQPVPPAGPIPTPLSPRSNPSPPRQESFPVPPGMEIFLPDKNGVERKYTVKYSMYTMKRNDALEYMERLANAGRAAPSGAEPNRPGNADGNGPRG